MSKNRLNPLDEAYAFGEILSYNGVEGNIARRITEDFAFSMYHKPRARRYKNLWIDAAMRGFESRENAMRLLGKT